MKQELPVYEISVRDLVEFLLRAGDIQTGEGFGPSLEVMQMGSRLHRKLQKNAGALYEEEVSLSGSFSMTSGKFPFLLKVTGRADGIFQEDQQWKIEEIKGTFQNLGLMEGPVPVHRAQALCYAYLYAMDHPQEALSIRMAYCHMITEEVRYFRETIPYEEGKAWFLNLLEEYRPWAAFFLEWKEKRNRSLKKLTFPFPYREGQKKLVRDVYYTMSQGKNLFLQAPTGVGKTISTAFPAMKALGEGLADRIFYLTAKTSTTSIGEQAFGILREEGGKGKIVTLTAKEKVCILPEVNCTPEGCPRAKGHYDRINDCLYDLITHEDAFPRQVLLDYAEKYQVCPFELTLDAALYADVIIGDYNYAFDPTVSLKRFFAGEGNCPYLFLMDEAHNLVDRAREMFSAELYKEDILEAKREVKAYSKKLTKVLDLCNKDMLELKRECVNETRFGPFTRRESLGALPLHLMQFTGAWEEVFRERRDLPFREKVLPFLFEVRKFLSIYDLLDENYVSYTDFPDGERFRVRLQCMNPAVNLQKVMDRMVSGIFFSATLLPIQYYQEQLGGRREDYAVYAESAFPRENRLLLIGEDVTTRYRERGEVQYRKIAAYLQGMAEKKVGNYLAFFPSYAMEEAVGAYLEDGPNLQIIPQNSRMTEAEKEAFLLAFQKNPPRSQLGLCVLGGSFGEGIDLAEDRLIGAIIVGTGIPMVCQERELFREYYDEMGRDGYAYAYQYPGMNKVLQAAGRVIRTETDRGVILLLDERFKQKKNLALFPREWNPYHCVRGGNIWEALEKFWEREEND